MYIRSLTGWQAGADEDVDHVGPPDEGGKEGASTGSAGLGEGNCNICLSGSRIGSIGEEGRGKTAQDQQAWKNQIVAGLAMQAIVEEGEIPLKRLPWKPKYLVASFLSQACSI